MAKKAKVPGVIISGVVEPDILAAVEKLAKRQGISVSQYVRAAVVMDLCLACEPAAWGIVKRNTEQRLREMIGDRIEGGSAVELSDTVSLMHR